MKKIFVFLAFSLVNLTIGRTQINLYFQDLDDMETARGAITSTGDNNYFYVSNGFSPTIQYTTEVEKYDIANDNWSVLTSLLIPKQFASSVIVGNNLYVFNGQISGGKKNRIMEVISLSNGSVSLSTDNPAPASNAGAAVWNGSIYVFGGSDSTGFSNKLYRFDTSNQTWTRLADMPEGKETTGEIINGKLYVIGGYNGVSSDRIDMYDIQTDVWTHLFTMPTSISGHTTAVYGSKIFTVFDYTNQTKIGYYDILSNSYVVLNQTSMKGRRNGGAEIVGDKLYIMGGNTNSFMSSATASLQVTDIAATGIYDEKERSYMIYPNPVSNELILKSYSQDSEIIIYDLLGKIIIQQKLLENRIDINKLPNGTYILKIVERNNEIIEKRFIKQ